MMGLADTCHRSGREMDKAVATEVILPSTVGEIVNYTIALRMATFSSGAGGPLTSDCRRISRNGSAPIYARGPALPATAAQPN
jgi:hypothetical protein